MAARLLGAVAARWRRVADNKDDGAGARGGWGRGLYWQKGGGGQSCDRGRILACLSMTHTRAAV